MRIINGKIFRILFVTVLISTACVTALYAHDTWVTLHNYLLNASTPAVLTVANAHHFPALADEVMTPDRIEKLLILAPDGKELPVALNGEKQYQPKTPLKAQGTYVAVVSPKNGFFSKTTDGYQQGKNKKDLQNVVACRYSEKNGKALFVVAQPGGDIFSRPLGHKLEIIPMKDPGLLKEGDELPVKVLVEGQPARTYVFGTYEGFSGNSNTYAYTTSTDKEGVAKIKLIKAGNWLLLAKVEKPYPDAAVCDKLSYSATLTFQVR